MTHDAVLVASEPGSDLGAWLERLQALIGLDDDFDGLLERARPGNPDASLIAQVRARLERLR